MKKWNIILAALLTLFSCSDETELVGGFVNPSEDNISQVTLSMQMPGAAKPFVYAASEEDENFIHEIDILAFAKQNILTDTFVYRIKVDAESIKSTIDAVNGNRKEIHVKLKRSDVNLKLVLIANSRAILDNVSIQSGDRLDEIQDKLIYDFDGKWLTSPMTPIPMWGQTQGYISIKNPVITEPVSVKLLRSVAKIDVGIDVYGDPAIGFGSRFKLNKVYVYNTNNKGFIIPDLNDTGLAEDKVTQPTIPASAESIKIDQEYTVTDRTLFNEIYVPEAKKDSNDRTFLILGGSYDGGSESYYRIDFVNTQSSMLDLLRNHRFLVNITNVARDGFASKEEAAAAKTSHIEYSLGVSDENINSIVYNGQYMLGVGDNTIFHDWVASSANTVSVATDYPSGWSASTDASWISLTTSSGGVNGMITYNVSRNDDDAHLVRTGTIKVAAGSLTQEITVRQYLGSNSVVVSPGDLVQIPVLYANADGVQRITDNTSLQPEVIWQDSQGTISSVSLVGGGKSSIIHVTAGSSSGNAVVAIKNGANVLWSWHVWVTAYNPELSVLQKSYNGTVFMDRNLGATSDIISSNETFGLLYQWGRKDPFPGASSASSNTLKVIVDGNGSPTEIGVEKVAVANNFENSIRNPQIFYTSDEFPWYNWYGLEEVNNSLWLDVKGEKTAYDPCPQGWRVPVNTEVWKGISTTKWNNGFTLSSVGYFPATGSLDFANGKLVEVGAYGYYWTASASGFKAKAMSFNVSNFSLFSTPFRSGGYSVRCVKE